MLKVAPHKLKLIFFAALIFASLSAAAFPPKKALALSGSDFQAGRIIDDSVFFNPGTMNPQEIQSFLNSKVPVCDTNGTQSYGGTTRASYAASRGYSTPFTCLKDYSQSTGAKPSETGLCNGYGAVNQSAAQIIYNVAQSCGINPKVLLVLLEKEQNLITDDWPWSIQYRSATGYGCPDTAPCDAEYYGFFNQVYAAARQFKYYAKNANSFNYLSGRNNFILYNPNSSCGGSTVYIQNQATAGLYNYTPYQPNASALNNLYGSGDSCGAYGNRNFWRMFNDWFGSSRLNVSLSNINWKLEILDGTYPAISQTPGKFGMYSYTLAVGNILHVFYYDESGGNLRHSWADPGGWHFETIDGQGGSGGQIDANVGGFPKAIMHNNQLAVAYYDFQNHALRLSTQSGGSWTSQIIDGDGQNGHYSADIGQDISLASLGSSLQLLYYDATNGNLRHAWTNSGQWHYENLDGDLGSVAHLNSNLGQSINIQTVGSELQAFYLDSSNGNLRHAWANATGWHFENLDGDPGSVSRQTGSVGAYPSFIAYGGTLQLFYYDLQNHLLRHGWSDNNGWRFENLDGDPGSVSRQTGSVGTESVIIPLATSLNVFYYDSGLHALRQAWIDSGGWHFAHVDGTSTAVTQVNIPVASSLSGTAFGGGVQLYYYEDASQTLKHAFGYSNN